MSHPDPLYDEENTMDFDINYDDHNDFWGLPENELDEIRDQMNEDEGYDDDYDDSMDGDHESGLASAGWGTDEDYGYFGDYNDDGPYDD
jgi:hypothetical protein